MTDSLSRILLFLIVGRIAYYSTLVSQRPRTQTMSMGIPNQNNNLILQWGRLGCVVTGSGAGLGLTFLLGPPAWKCG